MDLTIKQASEEFLADSNFVTSGAFIQFLWKQNIDQFKTRCEQRKSEQPLKITTQVEEEVKQEMMEEFKEITPEKGREMVAKVGVLILPEWDIVDALVLDAVRKETKPMEGVTFSKDNVAHVMWSLKKDEKKIRKDASNSILLGGMIVKRVQDTGVVEAASIVLETAKFSVAMAEKEAQEKDNLQLKLKTILKAYNDAKEGIANRDNIIARLQSQLAGQYHPSESSTLMIASSLSRPPPTSPIIEYPPSPMPSSFQLP